MDCDKWMTYRHFSNMYDHAIEELYEAGVAEKLDSSVLMNSDGEKYQL